MRRSELPLRVVLCRRASAFGCADPGRGRWESECAGRGKIGEEVDLPIRRTVKALLALAILLPIAAEGCELSSRSILEGLSPSNGSDVVSLLWDGGECEKELLNQVSRGSAEWLNVALALEPYSDAAAAETLEAAMSHAMQRAPSRVLPLLDRSRFGVRLCVPISFDDTEGSEQRFRAQFAAARRMYVDYLGTSLAKNARACLKEVDTVEASLTKPESSQRGRD